LFRRPNFFSFETPNGGVFLRCSATECLILEGGDRPLFAEMNKQLDFGALPEPDQRPGDTPTKTTDQASVPPVISGSR